VHAIDTGAVWGGKLTALQLDTDELRLVQVQGRDVPAQPPRPRPPHHPGDKHPQRPRQNQQGQQRRHNGRPHPNAPHGPRNEAQAPKAASEQDRE